jgi:hypothetical protein
MLPVSSRTERDLGCFTRLRVGSGSSEIIIKEGDKIKLPYRKGKLYATVKGFRTCTAVDENESYYCGKAEVIYIREPQELFGSEIISDAKKGGILVSLIDFSSRATYEVSRAEINDLLKLKPCDVEVAIFASEGGNAGIMQDGFELLSGVDYYKFGVQIIANSSKKGVDRVVSIPQSSSKCYSVRLILGDRTTDADQITDYGVTDKLWTFDSGKGHDVEVVAKQLTPAQTATAWYCFGNYNEHQGKYPLRFRAVGKRPLRVEVINRHSSSSDFVVFSKVINVTIKALLVSDYSLRFDEPVNEAMQLGSYLPPFTIEFLDDSNNRVEFYGNSMFHIKSPNMTIHVGNLEQVIFEMEEDGSIQFDRQWLPTAKPNFFSKSNLVSESKEVEFTLNVYLPKKPDSAADPKYFTEVLGTPKTFRFSFIPGKAYDFIRHEPAGDGGSGFVRVQNHSPLPAIVFSFVDKWGYNTAPLPGKSWIVEAVMPCPIDFHEKRVEVSSSGRARFHVPSVNAENVSLGGLELEQSFVLIDESDVEEISDTPVNEVYQHKPSHQLRLLVLPSDIPARVEILHEGEPVPRPWRVPVKSTISKLSYRVTDEQGLEIPYQSNWFRAKNAGVMVSWAEKKGKAASKIKSADLPSIKIPANPSLNPSDTNNEIDIEICVVFSEDNKLYDNLTIIPVPGVAVALDILTSKSLSEGISYGDTDDLISKIEAVVLLDEFGNLTKPESGFSPKIRVSWTEKDHRDFTDLVNKAASIGDDNMDIDNDGLRPRGTKRSASSSSDEEEEPVVAAASGLSKKARTGRSSAAAHVAVADDESNEIPKPVQRSLDLVSAPARDKYVLREGSSLRSPAGRCPIEVWITAYDPSDKVKSCTKQCMLVSGPPYKVVASSSSLRIPTASSQHQEVIVNRFSDIRDLQIKLWDRAHNLPQTLKRFKNITYKITCSIPMDMIEEEVAAAAEHEGVYYQKPKRIHAAEFTHSPSLSMKKIVDDLIEKYHVQTISAFTITIGVSLKSEKSEELITLLPAKINCSIAKVNAVVRLELDVISPGAALSRADGEMQYAYEESFPLIHIRAITDDDQHLALQVDDLDFKVIVNTEISPWDTGSSSHSIRPSKKANDVNDLSRHFVLQASGSSIAPTCTLSISPATMEAPSFTLPLGLYTISIHYHEHRAELATILPEPFKKIDSFKRFHLVHGRPTMIQPSHDSKAILESLSVSNSSKLEDRLIADKLVFQICDLHGNPCHIDLSTSRPTAPSMQLRCFINHAHHHDPAFQLPELENAVDGHCYSSISTSPAAAVANASATSFTFPSLSIKEASGSGDGIIALMFEAVVAEDVSSPLFSPKVLNDYQIYVAKAHFITNEGRRRMVNEMRSTYATIAAEMTRFEEEIARQRELITRNQHYVTQLMKKASAKNLGEYMQLFRGDYEGVDSIVLEDFARYLETLVTQHHDMLSYQTQRRACQAPALNPQAASLRSRSEVHGRVVEIGHVEDDTIAKVSSWGLLSYLDAMIVDSSEVAQQFFEVKQKSWAIDQMIPFAVEERGSDGRFHPRPRNAAELADKKLPLPELRNIPGNPRYLVNLIQLHDADERFRDTVFWTLFKRGLLFDDMTTALNYRRDLVRERKSIPIILTMDGNKLASDGLMNPLNRMPAGPLPTMFGQLNTSDRDITIIDAGKPSSLTL